MSKAHLLAVALLVALATAVTGAATVAASPPGPQQVALRFIRTAVQRQHPERAKALVTWSISRGVTDADWRRGFIRVEPFPYPHVTVRLSVVERRPRLVTLQADLRAAHDQGTFLITLVLRQQRWLVDYWGPAMLIGPGGSLQ
jgi:hypothetical protein